ncbi:hypothetical protein [Flavobacterium facile]|uniref:hypothetical protein n=1 Tax=Flavobacterium facile TaxID=2893174 RepID=UPI002E76F9CF|nr:hypothetical protein [Flavobacterium sp. T-12]
MKKLIFSLGLLATIFTGCTKDDETEAGVVTPTGEISGNITSNVSFAANGIYTLKGIVRVKSGATLTIGEGSKISCDKANGDNALVVELGGKVNIVGSASAPIVFTEISNTPGSWGGITIYGDAPIKVLGGGTTGTSEDGLSLPYGGSNSAHDGGILSYVRVEYAGKKIADGTKETNSFTFYSVGTGTQLNHLVAYKGADDGYEFFGGTASMSNCISYGNYDDAFDWQDGWQGQNNSNWFGNQVDKGNFGMEIETSSNNNAFWPKVTNVTLNRQAGCVPEVVGAVEIDAFQFKKQGNGEFINVVVNGYGSYTEGSTTYQGAVVKIQDASTNTDQVNAGKIILNGYKSTNNGRELVGATAAITVSFPSGKAVTNASATGAVLTPGAWTVVNSVNLLQM